MASKVELILERCKQELRAGLQRWILGPLSALLLPLDVQHLLPIRSPVAYGKGGGAGRNSASLFPGAPAPIQHVGVADKSSFGWTQHRAGHLQG